MKAIRVLIADDHRIVRQGLRHVCELAEGLSVVGEAEDGWEAVKFARQLQPDVILMDINMPVLDGVQATSYILDANPAARVIILTMYRQDRYVFEAIKAGARGYLLKDIDEGDLVKAIRAVDEGEALINPGLAVKLLDEFRRLSLEQTGPAELDALTPLEMRILKLVAQGVDNRTISQQLYLSDRTIANHLSRIYAKLHVQNRTQAALAALRRGWVNLKELEGIDGQAEPP